MRSIARHFLRSGALLLFVAALLVFSTLAAGAAPFRSPARAPRAALPATPCTAVGTTQTCELWATTGSITLPGSVSVPIWGYGIASGAATLPGPALIVNQGDTVNVILHNDLPAVAGNTSLAFPSQSLAPDATGIPNGIPTKTYTFAASNPGTYLYEAGLTANGPVQAAMGLFGGLVVHSSTPGTAYGSAFDDESLLVLSEVDPALNTHVRPDLTPDPTAFDLRDYAPKYWLINGRAYPDTQLPDNDLSRPNQPFSSAVAASPGNTLLLRYVNAGLEHHSMSLAGLHQTVLATDAQAYPYSYRATAETIPAGATLDTLATIPLSAPAGAKYALYEAANHLDNNGARTGVPPTESISFGGMLTFVTVSGTPAAAGPPTSNVTLTPNPTNGSVPVTLNATVGVTGGPTVTAAEYFVDAVGANGSGCVMSGTPGAPPLSVSAMIPTSGATAPCVDLATLSSGNHAFYVHGQDANGWGAVASAVLNLDKLGPVTSLLALNPNPTNGTVNVALDATGSDVGRGNSNVDAAEYFIDGACPPAGTGGSGTAMTQATPPPPTLATTVHFTATLTAATVNGLSQGSHTIYVHSHDHLPSPSPEPGNWGPCATITLNVDKTGPTTSAASTTPNPTNGTIGVIVDDRLMQRIDATASDPVGPGGIRSNLKGAEYFIDTVGADGTGGVFFSNGPGGIFNSPGPIPIYASIPLYGIAALSQGQHTIYIHAQDVAGNWGGFTTTLLNVDKTGPNTTINTLVPNPTGGATSLSLNYTVTDPPTGGTPLPAPASVISNTEWFIGPDQGVGLGTLVRPAAPANPVTINTTVPLTGLTFNSYLFSVRGQDLASNWGPADKRLLNVLPSDGIFADGFELGNLSAPCTPFSVSPCWNGGVTGNGLTVARTAAMGATVFTNGFGMQAVISGGASGYVQDNSPVTTATGYRARFYFNPNGTTTVTGQQHDIFVALNTGGATVFRIQYRRSSSSGNAAQVRAVVSRSNGGGNPVVGTWFTINTNAANVIEVSWLAGTSTTFTLYTNGTAHPITSLNTNSTTFRIDTVRLGPQVGPNAVGGAAPPTGTTLAGASGTEYFDSFVSRTNNTLIGP